MCVYPAGYSGVSGAGTVALLTWFCFLVAPAAPPGDLRAPWPSFTHHAEVIPGWRAGARRPENPVIRECSISPSHQALPSFSRTSREGGLRVYKLEPQRSGMSEADSPGLGA